ncbi:MAG: hypothetical protein KDC34_01840 [Saprospiraceae bacterium]|nr:hypothetical protein [Saprospiraceae bacterium]
MRFKDLIGQKDTLVQVRQMLDSARMPHAMMFLGQKGSGKLTLALAVAQAILCENRNPGEDSCGQCSQCQKVSKLIHPDLHFSFPTVGPKATSDQFLPQWREALAENPFQNGFEWLQRIGSENQQGNITKEECTRILHKIGLKVFEGSHKVLIIWLPEYLGNEGNRLLKLIEEPPEQTVFILVAEEADKILNTILSRCQVIRIPPMGDAVIRDALVSKQQLSEEQASALAFLSDGNYNEALRLHQEGINDHASDFIAWLRACYQGKPAELVEWSNKLGGLGRENQKQLLQYGLHFLRELMSLKTRGVEAVRLQANELETAKRMDKVISWLRLEAFAELFSVNIYHIERNAHARLQFLDAGIRIYQIFKSEDHELRRLFNKA